MNLKQRCALNLLEPIKKRKKVVNYSCFCEMAGIGPFSRLLRATRNE